MVLQNPNLEGYEIVRNFWQVYYNSHKGTFVAPKKCSGCYNNDRFVVWAVAVASQAVVDGARIYKELRPLVPAAIEIFQKYKNPHLKGFSAAENNGNDKDIYYDDDAQVCSAMLTAFEVTGDKKYLDQGRELVRFLMGGWNDDPNAKTKGGMRWHVSKTLLNSCTTAEVAKCCLQIASFIPNEAKIYIDFAAKCIDWQIKVLQDPEDKLIKDGVGLDSTDVDDVKWSYNTGTTLSAASLLYHHTKDSKWKAIADDLAKAAINRGVFFYDRDYPDELRYWRDPSYFVQLLLEGLADYLLFVGDEAPDGLPQKIHTEVRRHLIMFYEYMKDPKDGLYLQSFEPHNTYKETYEHKYKREFDSKKGWGLKGEDKGDDGEPQKCLMGGGAAARVFFQGARIVPEI
ncbi:glycoside hydrolase family 76 protein [Suhomyces tanzawaensis NRRL Y-17324]|uniref:Glycoside hydrolase family 76 protein n=1 Tax=Suhomyces tanzawaensis NRRL Y-17324 TaxID=984487 RepID=A0A1E4SG97_9ASCO|nr:glycoside hydrolase family 76 protein [Suhomyces tanzawaensis NRRL Y-17324]ODV78490.1 glycoside hydrolase family 76 protein [Suhomyces tanzawaensis NRRL Y-17324]